jgi:CRISPR-associated endoribonuclease Cas6
LLVSAIIRLQPLEEVRRLPFLGRMAHAALLRWVRGVDEELAQQLHQDAPVKPFTVSSPIRSPDGFLLRITGCDERFSRLLLEGLQPNLLPQMQLGDIAFKIKGFEVEARSSYQELARSSLLDQEAPPSRITLAFLSPTTFRSGGKNLPLPLPGLVFGSLLERWNAFSPVTFPEDTRRFAEECLALARYRLRTTMVEIEGGKQVGFVGWCTYTALVKKPYWLRAIEALAEFALYGGVGAKTTMGLGQARRLKDTHFAAPPLV